MNAQRAAFGATIAAVGIVLTVWARPQLLVIGTLVWTVVILRVIGFRATLGPALAATYLVLGVLLQFVVLPFPAQLAAPFVDIASLQQEPGTLAAVLGAMELSLLVSCVIVVLKRTRGHESARSAEVLLVAFMVGAGAQLAAALQIVSERRPTFPFFWPGMLAYWCGIAVVVWAIASRFFKSRSVALALTATFPILFLAAFTGGNAPIAEALFVTDWKFRLSGPNSAAWAVLVALLTFAWLERNREDRSLAAAQQDAFRPKTAQQPGLAPAMLALVLLVLLLALPEAVTRKPWSVLTVGLPITGFPSFVNLFLIAVIVWLYLPTMGMRSGKEGDFSTRLLSAGQRLILDLSMGCVVLVLANVNLVGFHALSGPVPAIAGVGAEELTTLLLLIAAAASGLALYGIPEITGARSERIQNAARLAQPVIAIWMGVLLGKLTMPALQQLTNTGAHGAALLGAVSSTVLGFVSALVVRGVFDLLKSAPRPREAHTVQPV